MEAWMIRTLLECARDYRRRGLMEKAMKLEDIAAAVQNQLQLEERSREPEGGAP